MCSYYSKMAHSNQVKINTKKQTKNTYDQLISLSSFCLHRPRPLSGINKRNGEVLNGMPIK